ncbi:MAG: RNA methyltransferase [Pseudomonadota bacterium]
MTERTTRITDPTDPRIADYINIRERDLLRDHDTFIAEGKTVLQVLVRASRFPIKSLLILENRINGIAPMIDALPSDVPVYVANRAVMDAIAGFPMHRGVLAAARKTNTPLDLDNATRVVVLNALANHDNVGAVFRNAAAFGFDAVLLDEQCCDPLYRKAIRVSVGGVLQVPFRHGGTIETVCDALKAKGFSLVGLAPNGAHEISQWAPRKKSAIVLGAEGPGLPERVLTDLETVRIAMPGSFDSLNVATAGAIAMHHMVTHKT